MTVNLYDYKQHPEYDIHLRGLKLSQGDLLFYSFEQSRFCYFSTGTSDSIRVVGWLLVACREASGNVVEAPCQN